MAGAEQLPRQPPLHPYPASNPNSLTTVISYHCNLEIETNALRLTADDSCRSNATRHASETLQPHVMECYMRSRAYLGFGTASVETRFAAHNTRQGVHVRPRWLQAANLAQSLSVPTGAQSTRKLGSDDWTNINRLIHDTIPFR